MGQVDFIISCIDRVSHGTHHYYQVVYVQIHATGEVIVGHIEAWAPGSRFSYYAIYQFIQSYCRTHNISFPQVFVGKGPGLTPDFFVSLCNFQGKYIGTDVICKISEGSWWLPSALILNFNRIILTIIKSLNSLLFYFNPNDITLPPVQSLFVIYYNEYCNDLLRLFRVIFNYITSQAYLSAPADAPSWFRPFCEYLYPEFSSVRTLDSNSILFIFTAIKSVCDNDFPSVIKYFRTMTPAPSRPPKTRLFIDE